MIAKTIQDVPRKDIDLGNNVRPVDPEHVRNLAGSIKEHGQKVPCVGKCIDDKVLLIEGFHTFAACELAGVETVSVRIVEEDSTEEAQLLNQLITNCLRQGLNDVQKARGIEAYMAATGCNASRVAIALGLSPSAVSSLRTLTTAPQPILDLVEKGAIPTSSVVELMRLTDLAKRAEMTQQLLVGKLTRDAITGARKAAKRPAKHEASRMTRVTAALGESRSITVSSVGLTLEMFIALIEELLAKARKERSRGTELSTFISLLKDQARAK
ncbi:MAG TPA: ParB N-terminal domain-containing protein [Pirellulales bacterium]|jgi:ParB/RepB/Spo0J family partition protein|nr:ParB N-terminal domain-containing protein [Pirellulales bacterium]